MTRGARTTGAATPRVAANRDRRVASASLAKLVAPVQAQPREVDQALTYARALAAGTIANPWLAHLLERSERDRLGSLRVLECAIASRDQHLMQLVAHAVIADWPGLHGHFVLDPRAIRTDPLARELVSDRPLSRAARQRLKALRAAGVDIRTPEEVEEMRRDRWGRVLGHLAGTAVGILDRRQAEPLTDPADHKVHVRAWVSEHGGDFHPARRGFSIRVEPGMARGKRHVVAKADRALVLSIALELSGKATLTAECTCTGNGPIWRKCEIIPSDAPSVRRLVSRMLESVERAAKRALRRPVRRHIGHMASVVAIYLLRRGHGALVPRGLRASVRAYFGRPDDGCRSSGCSTDQRTVRNLEAQAIHALSHWRAYHGGA